MLKGVSLYLVGMMGSGKSTVGRLLADRLAYRFVDLDSLIERVSGVPVAESFAVHGEAAFRALETRVLSEVASYTRVVVATGGGVVLAQHNWGHLRHGVVVWLDAPLETLTQNVLEHPGRRPLLFEADPRAQLERLLTQRRSLYAEADLQVAVEGPPEAVARTVLVRLAERLAADRDEQ